MAAKKKTTTKKTVVPPPPPPAEKPGLAEGLFAIAKAIEKLAVANTKPEAEHTPTVLDVMKQEHDGEHAAMGGKEEDER